MSRFIVRIMGGLGNQLFQYASIKGLSLKYGAKLLIDDSWFSDKKQKYYYPMNINRFNITYENYANKNIYKYPLRHRRLLINPLNELSRVIKSIPKYIKEEELENNLTPGSTIYFDGYWQNYRYFEQYEKQIKEEFTLSDEISSNNLETFNLITNSLSVAVHIRRGVYYSDPDVTKDHFHCSLDYYRAAIEKIKEKVVNPKFVLFSNDINWVRDNFDISCDKLMVNTEGPDYEHLFLMSNCKHNIIADSTFSWWGAWLNGNDDKVVIAPKRWKTGENGLKVEIPSEWIQIEN